MEIHLWKGGVGRGWGAKNEQFRIGRRIRANNSLSVDESEVQKGGHFGAERTIDRPRSWARRAATGHGRTWADFGGPGEDILLETNPQNRARPQDDVSKASPNSFKLYIIYSQMLCEGTPLPFYNHRAQ